MRLSHCTPCATASKMLRNLMKVYVTKHFKYFKNFNVSNFSLYFARKSMKTFPLGIKFDLAVKIFCAVQSPYEAARESPYRSSQLAAHQAAPLRGQARIFPL